MALTLESFWRYASSTCQSTSSDKLPTRLSSKFWGGRLLASRRCSASYRFVCCGLLRAWCSLGLPIGVEGSPLRGSHYYWAALLNQVAGSSSTPQGDRWARRSSRLLQRADSAAAVSWNGWVPATRPELKYASPDSSGGSKDAFFGRLLIASDIRVQSLCRRGRFVLDPRGSGRGLPIQSITVLPWCQVQSRAAAAAPAP